MECSFASCEKEKNSEKGEAELFKCCHYCYTFYCSRECRQEDWNEHKREKCVYGRVSSVCKRVLSKSGRSATFRRELSRVSRAGFLSTAQKGFVWIEFGSIEEAQSFIEKPVAQSNNLRDFLLFLSFGIIPKYVCFSSNAINQGFCYNSINLEGEPSTKLFMDYFDYFQTSASDEERAELHEAISDYDPNREMIIVVSVRPSFINETTNPRKETNELIVKFMRMSLLDLSSKEKETLRKFEKFDIPEMSSCEKRQDRELFLAGLLNEFRSLGIEIRSKYPKIYQELCSFVEENKPLTPTCLLSSKTDNFFMCLIMPNSARISRLN